VINRRTFLHTAAAAVASTAASVPASLAQASAAVPEALSADPDFAFTAKITLGNSYHHASDPGKVLWIATNIPSGDFEAGYRVYYQAGVDARTMADSAASKHHQVSAREAYLWAASYFSAALRFLDCTANPELMLGCWQAYAGCWAKAAAHFDPPLEKIEIPYEGTHLTGWFLRADTSKRRRPLLILNNGADGLEVSSYVKGAAGALARGYNCMIFNGPGQGDSLWTRKLCFRPDWEKVLTPVVETMIHHPEVDANRIAVIGISFGGFWVARSLAFEHRIAAAVVDPGIWDCAEPWMTHLPQVILDVLKAGKREQFDQMMHMGTDANARARGTLRFRMRPFGTESFFEAFHAIQSYCLADVVGSIRTPMLVTDSEGEQFTPGQARKLYDALSCSKTFAAFTRQQGADQHCEAAAPGIRDFTILNWLDEILA